MAGEAIRTSASTRGLRRTGWGIIDSDGVRLAYVACGSVCSDDGETLGVRLRQLFDGLQEVLARLSPVEATNVRFWHKADMHTALTNVRFRGQSRQCRFMSTRPRSLASSRSCWPTSSRLRPGAT